MADKRTQSLRDFNQFLLSDERVCISMVSSSLQFFCDVPKQTVWWEDVWDIPGFFLLQSLRVVPGDGLLSLHMQQVPIGDGMTLCRKRRYTREFLSAQWFFSRNQFAISNSLSGRGVRFQRCSLLLQSQIVTKVPAKVLWVHTAVNTTAHCENIHWEEPWNK